MPVIETATSAPKRSSAPFAIASATSGETGAVALDQRRVDAEQLGLGLVGVGDDAARHVGGGAGQVGHARRQQAAAARLRQAEPMAREQLRNLGVDRLAVFG